MMKYLLPYIIIFWFFGLNLNQSNAHTMPCNDSFDYKLIETGQNNFSIKIDESFEGQYIFKLFDITGNATVVEQLNSKDEDKKNIVFKNLKKGSYYLIQAISLDETCTSTIGGLDAIRFQN